MAVPFDLFVLILAGFVFHPHSAAGRTFTDLMPLELAAGIARTRRAGRMVLVRSLVAFSVPRALAPPPPFRSVARMTSMNVSLPETFQRL